MILRMNDHHKLRVDASPPSPSFSHAFLDPHFGYLGLEGSKQIQKDKLDENG